MGTGLSKENASSAASLISPPPRTFFSTWILWRANPDPCYLNCSSRAGKAAFSLLKTLANRLTRLAEQSPFYSSFLRGAPWGWGQGISQPEWQSWVLSKARPEPIHPKSWSLWAFPLRVSERCPKGWNQVSKRVALLLMARRDQEKEHWGIKGKIKGATRMPISELGFFFFFLTFKFYKLVLIGCYINTV